MKLRNWIEKAIGKQWAWPPVMVGRKGGREVYAIDWTDGTSGSYFIDFDEQTIEEWVLRKGSLGPIIRAN